MLYAVYSVFKRSLCTMNQTRLLGTNSKCTLSYKILYINKFTYLRLHGLLLTGDPPHIFFSLWDRILNCSSLLLSLLCCFSSRCGNTTGGPQGGHGSRGVLYRPLGSSHFGGCNVVAHWKLSRLLGQLSRDRIRHLSQWKTLCIYVL